MSDSIRKALADLVRAIEWQSRVGHYQREIDAARAALAEQSSGAQVQAFYKEPEAEPPYAQYARGVEDGFALGMRNAMQDAANAEQPSAREPLSELKRMQIIGEEFPLALVEPIVIQKIDAVCRDIERAHGIGVKGEA